MLKYPNPAPTPRCPMREVGLTIFMLTLSNVFVPFAFFYMKEPLKLDYLWAGLCIMGAVFFIFRGGMGAT